MGDLTHMQQTWGRWSDATFGGHRDPRGCLCHLAKEVDELREAPADIMEYADCLTLLLDAARRAGIDGDDILRASYRKLEINKRRQWGAPDANGVVEHVREVSTDGRG